ncbi:Hypothetical_protein [Hexamita inflata]|uniref:Hypothetical_protein n=1 Tax=Hexamita inflata TaxID=28002 RepID=A0AA86RQS5_9EUKA|nr:Hypothetical protein HINF_LOCUS64012 [Hexamita inflata]
MRAYTIHCCIQTSGVSEHIWKRHLTHVGRHLSVQGRETRFGRTLPPLTPRRYQTPPISVTGRSIKFTMKASKRESCTRWFSLDSVCPRQALWLLPSKDGLDRLVSPLCIEDTRISAESNQYFPNQSNISRIRPDSCVQVTFRVSADYRHSPLQRLQRPPAPESIQASIPVWIHMCGVQCGFKSHMCALPGGLPDVKYEWKDLALRIRFKTIS